MKAAALLFALVVIMWCAIAALRKPAHGHDIYSDWKDRRGYGCCHDRDCRPVRADLTEAGWRVWIDGRWVLVPPDAVLTIPSPDGRSHACISPGAIEPMCFVPGEARG
jgi:hypothetical protein